jgi:uncharacterized protein (TIGR00661 family)
MKILYAVQATGNGHISRAMEVLLFLQYYGKVDIFLSGDNSNLSLDAPVKYRSKGLSLYANCRGGLDIWQTVRKVDLLRIRQEIRDLPVEKYDLIINDFEFITAAACRRKRIHSVNFGHQASFQSAGTPRPDKRNFIGEWVLKNYAKASRYVGLHFKRYDDFIFPPIIKKEFQEVEPRDGKYILVYLPSFCEKELTRIFSAFRDHRFEIFCMDTKQEHGSGNLQFYPVIKQVFNHRLINCSGIITGAGFETPAEAIHLGKKLLCIPMKGQYEQACNAAALSQMGIPCTEKIDGDFKRVFENWINSKTVIKQDYSKSLEESLEFLFNAPAETDALLPLITFH